MISIKIYMLSRAINTHIGTFMALKSDHGHLNAILTDKNTTEIKSQHGLKLIFGIINEEKLGLKL
jgi:hypothetical protein